MTVRDGDSSSATAINLGMAASVPQHPGKSSLNPKSQRKSWKNSGGSLSRSPGKIPDFLILSRAGFPARLFLCPVNRVRSRTAPCLLGLRFRRKHRRIQNIPRRETLVRSRRNTGKFPPRISPPSFPVGAARLRRRVATIRQDGFPPRFRFVLAESSWCHR